MCIHACGHHSCEYLAGEQPEFEFVSFEVVSLGACLDVPAEVVSHEVVFLSQRDEELLLGPESFRYCCWLQFYVSRIYDVRLQCPSQDEMKASLALSKMDVWKCLLRTFSYTVWFGIFTAMSAPPKTKPPPPKESDGESDEGSETSDEETEDEEQGEGGSDFESESDKGTDTTKKKPTSILPSKQQVLLSFMFCMNIYFTY